MYTLQQEYLTKVLKCHDENHGEARILLGTL